MTYIYSERKKQGEIVFDNSNRLLTVMMHCIAIISIFMYLIKYIDYSVPNISLFVFFEIITIEFFYLK